MLQATYKDNTYTFYVTLKDAEQYIDGVRFDVPIVGDRYLFKFTNDMSGEVKWSYGKLITINNRYAELQVSNSSLADESVYNSKVNFEPNGYWKYEIFWIYDGQKVGSPTECDLFNPSAKGTWEATNAAGVVQGSGALDVDVEEITGLSADVFEIQEYSTCVPPPAYILPSPENTITQTITNVLCATSKRDILFTQVVRNKETTSFHIDSIATIGYEVRFVSDTRTYSHIITTLPESFVITVETGSGVEDSKEYEVSVYSGSSLVLQYNNAIAVRNPQQFRGGYIMASNNEWENVSCGTVVDGSIFFTWNKTGNSPNSGYITEYEAPLEIGKLLIGEPQGDEQVQYKQHEAPNDTNYIYND